ncbi:MAG: undecaprenyl/decaprenyl-phosphate alpha-N-acetylglucosaminyl 1-phosphate transferase [Synergistaceae bacterium]|nr:undecaprenyl/decaprenyl-phosphate alpha-N-acetylglucosaminyl 1-phosphate transferase [Synergistaceae bacterium]
MLTGLFSFFWGGFVTPLSIRLAYNYQIMDFPDQRKIHKERTPRGAGLGLWAGYLLWALYFVSDIPGIRYSALGATLVFFCGYMDDMKSLSPFIRLAVHLMAAALTVFPLPLPVLNRALCLVWIAGTTSAYNLIDGVNGLCISVFISSTLALCAVGDAAFGVMGAAVALGVLCWNFPMAQTFLGDGGSTLLGFLFASHFAAAASPVLAGLGLHELVLVFLLAGGIPVLDTLVAFCRRILRGRSPFYPDRGHLHHRFLEWTRSPFWAVACLLALHAFFLAGGVAVYTKLR